MNLCWASVESAQRRENGWTPNNFKSFKLNPALNEAKRRKIYYELMCFLFVWHWYLFIYPFLVLLFNGMSLSFIVSFINPLSNQQYMNSGSVYPLYWIFHEALTVLRGQKQLQGKEQQSFEL